MSTMRAFRRAAPSFMLTVLLTACGGSPAPADLEGGDPGPAYQSVPGSIDRDLVLRVGEVAVFAAEGLAVTFVGVVSDSRCPKEAVCVWEGSAEVRLRAEPRGAASTEVVLHTHPSLGTASRIADAYLLTLLEVQPYPSVQADPAGESVTATIRLTRAG